MRLRVLTLMAASALPFSGGTLPARAGTTITVTTAIDVVANDGLCSLREAVTAANVNAPSGASPGECPAGSPASPDFVSVPPGTYNLSLPPCSLAAASAMTIAGTGPTASTLDGLGACRVLSIGGTVTLSGLTIRNGNAATGGGISSSASLTVSSSTIAGNTATTQGGGVASSGTLTVSNSTITGNAAGSQGGGIFNSGTRISRSPR